MDQLQGHFLIASPALRDPNFNRAIVLLVQHSAEGALGLVINRPMEATIDSVWKQVKGEGCVRDDTVFQGGPCEGVLATLHARESLSEVEVMPGVHFSMNRDTIEELVESAVDGPVRFYIGYAGWGPGQLEAELEEGAWLALPASSEQVFDPPSDQWSLLVRALSTMGALRNTNPRIVPPDPTMN